MAANEQAQAALVPLFGIDNDDLNGECFIAGAEGEVEEKVNKNVVVFPPGTPKAGPNAIGEPVDFTVEQTNNFLVANVASSIGAGRTPSDATKVAYVRYLAARNGLISPDYTAAAHNVRYNHAEDISAAEMARLRGLVVGQAAVEAAIRATITVDFKRMARKSFTDVVCCIAYIFRVRGHHYRDDILDRYVSLWARCLKRESELPATWELLATDALHAIMPDILDEYWRTSAANAYCAGALIKRLDSAPAGVAGVLALKRGLTDVMMLFPGVADKVPDSFNYFQDVSRQVEVSRWGGSINCRFYGVQRIRVDEGKIGALASVVMGIYDQLATDSKLRESPALKRLAETAPATGGAIGMAARRTVNHPKMNLLLASDSDTSAGPTTATV
jgi:hypothetical protein